MRCHHRRLGEACQRPSQGEAGPRPQPREAGRSEVVGGRRERLGAGVEMLAEEVLRRRQRVRRSCQVPEDASGRRGCRAWSRRTSGSGPREAGEPFEAVRVAESRALGVLFLCRACTGYSRRVALIMSAVPEK